MQAQKSAYDYHEHARMRMKKLTYAWHKLALTGTRVDMHAQADSDTVKARPYMYTGAQS